MTDDDDQLDLFGEPPLDGPRDGDTFDPYRDEDRLNKQMRRVFAVMRDQRWHSLHRIATMTGDPEASISARLRDFRKEKFGGLLLNRRHVADGLWEYQLLPPDEETNHAFS